MAELRHLGSHNADPHPTVQGFVQCDSYSLWLSVCCLLKKMMLELNYISAHPEQLNTVCVFAYQVCALGRRSRFTEVHGPVTFRVQLGC